MNTEETKQKAYSRIKDELDRQLASGMLINIKGLKKVIAFLKKRIKLLESGTMFFARSVEDVEKANLAIASLSGELQAYQERYSWIQNKLKESV